MSFDPHALKLYVDGSCAKNPGGSGGFAAWIEFPIDWRRPDEELQYAGYFSTNSVRMEIEACIFAHEWVGDKGRLLDVQRFQIVTDSTHVFENYNRAPCWSQNRWRNVYGRPVENKDLWKKLLSIRRSLKVRVDVVWTKGKKSPILKAVDRSAKLAAKTPTEIDWGFKSGKVGRSKNRVAGAAKMFPAAGREVIIRIYQTLSVRRDEHKVKFQLYSDEKSGFFEKYFAYADAVVGNRLHRHHIYLVRMNDVMQYPRIEGISAEISSDELVKEEAAPPK